MLQITVKFGYYKQLGTSHPFLFVITGVLYNRVNLCILMETINEKFCIFFFYRIGSWPFLRRFFCSLLFNFDFYCFSGSTVCARNSGLHKQWYRTENFCLTSLAFFEPLQLTIHQKIKALAICWRAVSCTC